MSTITSGASSLPDLPEEMSAGSSVSTGFEKEYEEILQHAIVAPRFNIGEDVYKNTIEPVFIQAHNEELETSDSAPSTIQQDYREEKKITEAKQSMETKGFKTMKQLRFQVPSSALDSLLEYGYTPGQNRQKSTIGHLSDSTDSTPPGRNSISPPSVDKDLLRMDSLMDEWTMQLKRNVLAELADMKRRQYQFTDDAINEINLRHNADTLKMQHEIESLKELLYSFEQSVKQKDDVIQNLTDALNKQKGKSDKIRLFSMWRLKHNDEQRQEFSEKMAEKFYKRTLTMKVWAGWRSVVESRWKHRVEKACQIKSQEICLKLTQDYEERIQAIQRELASTRSEVAKMHTERDCYEENMKKAFMRGVCALNMEAMSMFHEDKNDDNITGSSNHYPCNGPGVPASVNPQYETNHYTQQADPSNATEHLRRHVTFNESAPTSSKSSTTTTSNVKKSIPSSRPPNQKNLHVRLTAKKDLNSSRKGTGSQSTISSIKVERHVPNDHKMSNIPSSTLPQYSKETTEDKYHFKRPTTRVPTVKVVD